MGRELPYELHLRDGGMTLLAVSPNSLHNPNPKYTVWKRPLMLALTTLGMRNGRD